MDHSTLKRIVSKYHTITAAKVTAELSSHLEDLFPQKQSGENLTNPTSMVELELLNLWLLKTVLKGERWCNDHKTWMSDDWKYVIWSGESSFMLFPTSGQVYVWRMRKVASNLECLVPTVKHGFGSTMIRGAISWYSAGRIITLNGRFTASDYLDILDNQLHPLVQMMFPNINAIFHDDSLPILTASSVQFWLRNMKMHFNIFPGQQNYQT